MNPIHRPDRCTVGNDTSESALVTPIARPTSCAIPIVRIFGISPASARASIDFQRTGCMLEDVRLRWKTLYKGAQVAMLAGVEVMY
jgi:hypothetical protein